MPSLSQFPVGSIVMSRTVQLGQGLTMVVEDAVTSVLVVNVCAGVSLSVVVDNSVVLVLLIWKLSCLFLNELCVVGVVFGSVGF